MEYFSTQRLIAREWTAGDAEDAWTGLVIQSGGGADDAAHDDFPVLIDRLFAQPVQGGGGQSGEGRADLGALGALPDDIARGPAPRDQQQRIDDNGFSRTRLPGANRYR